MSRSPLITLVSVVVPAVVMATAACSPAESTALTPDEYVEQMGAACRATAEAFDALPPPIDDDVAEFATLAADTIQAEAEAARAIDPPDDLDADHRAFIANTDDQASRWREIGELAATDAAALDRSIEEISQLTLGRDELVTEMGIDDCRRATG
jgi:hypothetical protein